MSINYRIYCNTEVGWVSTWSDTAPTACPNDAGHSVNENSVQELSISQELLRIPIHANSKSNTFSRLSKFQFNPTVNGTIRTAKAICYKEGTMTDFTVQIYDATHNLEIINVTISNTVEETVVDLGAVTNHPTENCVLEVSIKRNGGNSKSIAYVDEIVLYS